MQEEIKRDPSHAATWHTRVHDIKLSEEPHGTNEYVVAAMLPAYDDSVENFPQALNCDLG